MTREQKNPPFRAAFCFFGFFFHFPLDFLPIVCYYTLEHRVSDVLSMFPEDLNVSVCGFLTTFHCSEFT